MLRGLIIVSGVSLALVGSCGRAEKPGNQSSGSSDAGETGAGGTSAGGTGARGGTTGAGTAGSSDGGEPSDGGAPTGGRGGATTGGAGSGGVAGSSTAGSAGAAGVRLPDGCTPNGQHVGGTYCSAEMICDTRRLSVSCTEVTPQLWSCSCTGDGDRVDFEFPDATGSRTCEAAAKACADPDILTGDETCVRTHTEGVLGCAIHDTCDLLKDIDGVTLRARRLHDAECGPCNGSSSSCCSCEDEMVIDHRVRDIDLALGCDFLDELCKPDNIDPVGAMTCETLQEDAYPDEICTTEVRCDEPVELGDGTRLTLSEEFVNWCYVRPEGLRCTCQNESGVRALALDLGSRSATVAACREAVSACSNLEPLEFTAARRCTPTTDVVQEGGCIFYVDCTQAATAGGTEVTVFSQIGSQCELEADGSFTCYCNNRTAGPYEIEAEDSAVACPRAIEVCPPTYPTL